MPPRDQGSSRGCSKEHQRRKILSWRQRAWKRSGTIVLWKARTRAWKAFAFRDNLRHDWGANHQYCLQWEGERTDVPAERPLLFENWEVSQKPLEGFGGDQIAKRKECCATSHFATCQCVPRAQSRDTQTIPWVTHWAMSQQCRVERGEQHIFKMLFILKKMCGESLALFLFHLEIKTKKMKTQGEVLVKTGWVFSFLFWLRLIWVKIFLIVQWTKIYIRKDLKCACLIFGNPQNQSGTFSLLIVFLNENFCWLPHWMIDFDETPLCI